MNIGKTIESLNSLINKNQRNRISRHTKFMKQQKRSLIKTLKQDKMYRQQLHNMQEEMFNSTITRSNGKIKRKTKSLDLRNKTVAADDTISQSISNNSQLCESANITIVISKVVIDSTNPPTGDGHNGNLSKLVKGLPKCSVLLDHLDLNSTINEEEDDC